VVVERKVAGKLTTGFDETVKVVASGKAVTTVTGLELVAVCCDVDESFAVSVTVKD